MEDGALPAVREVMKRKRMKSVRMSAEIVNHAQAGREIRLANTIPTRKDKEIHNNGMLWILH